MVAWSRSFSAFWASLVLGLAACAPGPFAPQGYTNEGFAYVVGYENPGDKSLLPAPWRLDNYSSSFEEKRAGAYMAVREIDEDENGEISSNEKRDEAVFDLKLQNARDNGLIWTKAHPIRYSDRERDLSVVVDNYVASLSGSGLYEQGSVFGVKHAKQLSFVTFVKSKRSVSVDRHPAVEAIVELAEVEKLKLDPTYRRDRVKVVFVRFEYQYEGLYGRGPSAWPNESLGFTAKGRRRGMLVVGYANTSEAFAQSEAAFDGLVQRIRFPKSTTPEPMPAPGSMQAPPAASAGASPTPAPSASAPPPASSAR